MGRTRMTTCPRLAEGPHLREWMGRWWPPWTSNPVAGSDPVCGGFDSHTLPPVLSERHSRTALSGSHSMPGGEPVGESAVGGGSVGAKAWGFPSRRSISCGVNGSSKISIRRFS